MSLKGLQGPETTMKQDYSEESIKKEQESHYGRFFENTLSVMTREGARMMLRVALEEETTEAVLSAMPF